MRGVRPTDGTPPVSSADSPLHEGAWEKLLRVPSGAKRPLHLRAKCRLWRLRSETRLRAQPLHKGGFCAFGARNNNLQNQKIAMIGIVAIFRVLMYNVSNVYF